MMIERFKRTGIQFLNSDLFQIGIHGIGVKQIDKINMSDKLSRVAKWTLAGAEAATVIGLAASCVGTEVKPTLSAEPNNVPSNGGQTFEAIPTPDTKELKDGKYQTEIYCSDDLAVCAFHQFDKNGNALAPRASINTKLNIDLDNNSVVITGDPLIENDTEVTIYSDEIGQNGYQTKQNIEIKQATSWMESMSEKGRLEMQTVIDEAKSNSSDIKVILTAILNIQNDNAGKPELVDMTAVVALSADFENSTTVVLTGKMNPFTKTDVLLDKQISAIDFVPQTDGTEDLVMEVYPSNWVEIGQSQYVSPEFIAVMDQVASTGEKFSVTPEGIIQETTTEGVKDVAGLSIDKKGQITIDVNGEKVLIDSADLVISDQEGLKINGYTLDTQTGLWSQEVIKEFPVCKIENFRNCVITEQELFDGTYLRWLQTLSKPFDASKVKDVPFDVMTIPDSNPMIVFDMDTAPNFGDPETAPFRRDVTFGIVLRDIDGVNKAPYVVKPIEFFDRTNPTVDGNRWVITVESYYGLNDPLTGEYLEIPDVDMWIDQNNIIWKKDMRITPIRMTSLTSMTNTTDPLTMRTFNAVQDLQGRFQRFLAGEVGALSEPGIVLNTQTSKMSDGLLK